MYPQNTNPYYQQPSYQQYPSVPLPNYNWQPQNQPSVGYSNNAAPRYVVGRAVNSPEEITAAEVPMDGFVRLFPSNDGLHVYRKEWDGDGRLNTRTYVLDEQQKPAEPSFEDRVMAHFDKLEDLIEKRDAPRRSSSRRDKEVSNEDA